MRAHKQGSPNRPKPRPKPRKMSRSIKRNLQIYGPSTLLNIILLKEWTEPLRPQAGASSPARRRPLSALRILEAGVWIAASCRNRFLDCCFAQSALDRAEWSEVELSKATPQRGEWRSGARQRSDASWTEQSGAELCGAERGEAERSGTPERAQWSQAKRSEVKRSEVKRSEARKAKRSEARRSEWRSAARQ